MLKKLLSRLPEFLEEPQGGFSVTRLVYLMWNTAFILVWLTASYHAKSMVAVDGKTVAAIVVLATAKVGQRYLENTPTPTDPPAA